MLIYFALRKAAKVQHPDKKTGSTVDFHKLNEAKEFLLLEVEREEFKAALVRMLPNVSKKLAEVVC